MDAPVGRRQDESGSASFGISGKNATENAASAVALLTTAIEKKTISTIADDDDRFVAGIFVVVFLRACFPEISRRHPLLR
jgi:hypothetical protein